MLNNDVLFNGTDSDLNRGLSPQSIELELASALIPLTYKDLIVHQNFASLRRDNILTDEVLCDGFSRSIALRTDSCIFSVVE